MTQPRHFPDSISWATLGEFTYGRDYEQEYSIDRINRVDGKKRLDTTTYLLLGFQVLIYRGFCHKNWDDGKLVDYKVFDISSLCPFPDFEYSEVGLIFKKQRISSIWFHSKRLRLSNFFKTTSKKEFDSFIDNHPDAPRFIGFDSEQNGMIDWYLERGGIETRRVLQLEVPFERKYRMDDFHKFLDALGRRILLSIDYGASTKALEFLDYPLSERYATIFP